MHYARFAHHHLPYAEAEIARTQKNKATEGHLGGLKAKIAKLKAEIIAGPKGGSAKPGDGFDVTKSGDVRIGMVGFPSVGKSSLLTALTGTKSEVASYEFTTLTCIPGTIHYRGARIQLLDLPGIIEGAKDGKGRGRQVIGTARTCDLILIVLDAAKPLTHKRIIEREMEGMGIRLNKKPANIIFTRKEKGGIAYRSLHPQPFLEEDTVKTIWCGARGIVMQCQSHCGCRLITFAAVAVVRPRHCAALPRLPSCPAARSIAYTTLRSRCASRTSLRRTSSTCWRARTLSTALASTSSTRSTPSRSKSLTF